MKSERRGRAVLIVLDGVGIGELPDAADYGDVGAATLQHVATQCGGLHLPNLERLGLGCIGPIKGVAAEAAVAGAHGRLQECAAGKDSTTGHWELAGVVLEEPLATFPNGFPDALVAQFSKLAGGTPLGNIPASGISILKTYGVEHVRTGRPILYTSVDSVFQIAAHEDILPLADLYRLCEQTRKLVDPYLIGRVIARPFAGNVVDGFRRTANRRDFSMPPPQPTLLDLISDSGLPVVGVGKIKDLFAGRGVTSSCSTVDNREGMEKTLQEFTDLATGLVMVNLIDFDMIFGHRQNVQGFARALEAFDAWLPQLCARLTPDDLLLITADHGCDPTTPGTDHTREYVPLLAWTPAMTRAIDLGTRQSMADVAATLAEFFGLRPLSAGTSFCSVLCEVAGVSA